ncbi:hypothetical protein K470DRAFT_269170 [Piedraia hortae CBS 480.64]|uniref:Mediator of RNA polymerase II transcription subunit 9 n=1 Tax=Piedraia hortae CBS 480.64 TaxID=1314780 RepID=A0A6A7C555_9PEZI|nr:hypothetical protein K470DRAFT_269170 [Piedraia hortae CBS 480.64]
MARKDASTTPAEAATPPEENYTLPPADLFDILPRLHEILARIEPLPDSILSTPDHPDNDQDIGADYMSIVPLEPKDMPGAVLGMKSQLRRAAKAVEQLPDMDCSVEELEKEVEALEAKQKRQREARSALGRKAAAALKVLDDAMICSPNDDTVIRFDIPSM